MQSQLVFGSSPEMRRTKEGWDPPFFWLLSAAQRDNRGQSAASGSSAPKSLNFTDHSMLRMKSPLAQKIWAIITWRWRLQIALNAPFALLWVADKTNPAVHAFNMTALSAMHAEWLAPMIGIA